MTTVAHTLYTTIEAAAQEATKQAKAGTDMFIFELNGEYFIDEDYAPYTGEVPYVHEGIATKDGIEWF